MKMIVCALEQICHNLVKQLSYYLFLFLFFFSFSFFIDGHVERVQKGIAYWNKQQYVVLASNCILKV